MDDLRVENYDAKEVAAKKRSILKRVVVAGGAIVLTLGLFSLASCVGREERVEEQIYQVEERELPPMPGGSGSWFVSILESA